MQSIHPISPIKLLFSALLLFSLPPTVLANEPSRLLIASDVSEQLAEMPVFNSRYDEAVFFLTPIFSVVDCEGAGEIEDSGVDEHFNTLFYYNDRDQSKYIVESEFVMGRNKASAEQSRYVFKMMDSDQNGKVTTLEYRRYISQTIELADLDKNGELKDFELDPRKKIGKALRSENLASKELLLSKPSSEKASSTSKDKAHTHHSGRGYK